MFKEYMITKRRIKMDRVVELIRGGSVINDYPV